MYVPKNMQLHDLNIISDIIAEHSFGTLISSDLGATRLPLIYRKSEPGKGYILGHMARANPQWRNLSGKRVSVLFNGPHAYISPTWYASAPAVPTWNYVQVQCFGIFHELNNADTLHAINALMLKYEPEIIDDEALMSPDYVNKLLKAVVGLRIEVTDIHAKEKLGQHKSSQDQLGVFEALTNSSNGGARELAHYMQQRNLGVGNDDAHVISNDD